MEQRSARAPCCSPDIVLKAGTDGVHFGPRLRQRHTRAQPSKDVQVAMAALGRVVGGHQRLQEIGAVPEQFGGRTPTTVLGCRSIRATRPMTAGSDANRRRQ